MTLKRRIGRLERVIPSLYGDVAEIPTPVLEAILRWAYISGEWPSTSEDRAVFDAIQMATSKDAAASLPLPLFATSNQSIVTECVQSRCNRGKAKLPSKGTQHQ
jgi:hypothetical protein